MPQNKWIKRHAYGFSLIEVLISVSIGVMIILFLTEMIQAIAVTYKKQIAVINLIDTAKKVTELMHAEISQAGYIGCAKLTPNFPIISHVSWNVSSENKVQGNDHMLTLRHANWQKALLKQQINATHLITNAQTKFKPGEAAIISDCTHAEIFQIADVKIGKAIQQIESVTPFIYAYHSNAEISKIDINTFYIKNHYLYLQDIKQFHTVLVEGVTEMNILYTVLTAQGIKTQRAVEISQWENVLGVGIEFSLSSPPYTRKWYTYSVVS